MITPKAVKLQLILCFLPLCTTVKVTPAKNNGNLALIYLHSWLIKFTFNFYYILLLLVNRPFALILIRVSELEAARAHVLPS